MFDDAGAHRANNTTLIAKNECGRISNAAYKHFFSVGTGPNRSKCDVGTGNILKNVIAIHSRTRNLSRAFSSYATDVKDVEDEMDKTAKQGIILYVLMVPSTRIYMSRPEFCELGPPIASTLLTSAILTL
jgi:hypothetical protein